MRAKNMLTTRIAFTGSGSGADARNACDCAQPSRFVVGWGGYLPVTRHAVANSGRVATQGEV